MVWLVVIYNVVSILVFVYQWYETITVKYLWLYDGLNGFKLVLIIDKCIINIDILFRWYTMFSSSLLVLNKPMISVYHQKINFRMIQHIPITETVQLVKTTDAWNIRCWFRTKLENSLFCTKLWTLNIGACMQPIWLWNRWPSI